MNSHLLDCTITGGERAKKEKGGEEGKVGGGALEAHFKGSCERGWLCLFFFSLLLECFIAVMLLYYSAV